MDQERLPALPIQFKTWKEFWMALGPLTKKGVIPIIKTIDINGFKEFHIKQIKEGVFREAIANPKRENLTFKELEKLTYLFHNYINSKCVEAPEDTLFLDKLNKLLANAYQEEHQK